MSARVIKGGPVAARIRAQVAAEVAKRGGRERPPRLQVLLAGDDPNK